MADQIKKLSAGHSIEVLDAIMTEVEEARGEYDNLGERLDEMSSDTPTPSTAAPAMDGTAAAGTSTDYARADHVHPSDTSRASATAEAEDRAALIELIDDGAKNVLDLSKAKSVSCPTELSYTIASDGTLTVTWSEDLSSSGRALRFVGMPHIDGTYILSGAQQATTSETIRADIRQGTSSAAIVMDYGQTPKPFAFGEGDFTYAIRIQTVAGSASFKPMICSVPAWKISQAYQPYRPSYQELYETQFSKAMES